VLDLSNIDLEEIANALADQTDYEHHWLINPDTGEIAFWTADTGIDGQTPVDLDELDLVVIGPLPSWVWYQDMADFADGITDERPGAGWHGRSRAREPSAASKTSSTRSTRTCCQRGTRSGTPGPGAGPSNGWPITPSFDGGSADRFLSGHPDPACPEPARRARRRSRRALHPPPGGKVRELRFHLLRRQTRVTYWLAPDGG
jgi:hypothetical protein